MAKTMGDEMEIEIGDAQESTWCLEVPLLLLNKD